MLRLDLATYPKGFRISDNLKIRLLCKRLSNLYGMFMAATKNYYEKAVCLALGVCDIN